MNIRLPLTVASLSMTLALISCGGGSGSDTSSSTNNTVDMTGTVPGTLIEAYCTDGSYHKVNSEQNETDQHPFRLPIPAGVNCRIVMITNENDPANRVITPISFRSSTTQSGTINAVTSFDIGHVPLATSRNEIVDANNDGVVDTPLIQPINESETFKVLELNIDPLDKDKNGIPNVYEDDDGDGRFNKEDPDSDGDGIDDDQQLRSDRDEDGIDDEYDRDDDNDGTDDDDDREEDAIDYDRDDDNAQQSNSGTYQPVSEYTVVTGRLLAAQCSQCHGTNGLSVNDWDGLAGESDLASETWEIQAGDEDPIMQAQAHGYTDAEIRAIATYFASLPSSNNDDD